MSARAAHFAEAHGLIAALPGLLAMVLGAFLVLGAGFSPISIIHNAAHDARHAMFPCH